MKKWAVLMFAGSVLMVLVQVMVAAAVVRGTFAKACQSNDQCDFGMFCNNFKSRCLYCGGAATPLDVRDNPDELDPEKLILNITSVRGLCGAPIDTVMRDQLGNDTPFGTDTVIQWCDRCVHAETYSVDPLTSESATLAQISAMTRFDWVALYFAAVIVALTAVAEIKDVLLCNLAIKRAGPNLSSFYRHSFLLINGVRRYTFLPCLLTAINFLVTTGSEWPPQCHGLVAFLVLCTIS